MGTITIRALKRPGKVFTDAAVKASSPDNPDRDITVGTYKGATLPRVTSYHRAMFSQTQGRYIFTMSDEEFAELVPKANVMDKKGNKITSADPYNMKDPFFSSNDFQLIDTEGRIDLNDEVPKNKLLVSCLSALPHQYHVADSGKPILGSSVKHEIIRPEFEKKKKNTFVNRKRKAFDYLQNMTDEKQFKVAIILKLRVNEKTDRQDVDTELGTAIEEDYNLFDSTFVEEFINCAEMESEILEVKYTIAMAQAKGILKRNAEGYLLFGNPIANSNTKLIKYFNNPENFEAIERVNKAIKF